MAKLTPTTKAQVSGYKFLKRRVEHGLMFGDIRMIHDPLARNRRAQLFGLAASVLLCVGAGALALFAPQANPGQAPILRAKSGQHYVLVDATYHPVPNVASAYLLAGEAKKPAAVGEKVLAQLPKGHAVGIPDAPGVFDSQDRRPEIEWQACFYQHQAQHGLDNTRDRLIVSAAAQTTPLAGAYAPALLSEVDGRVYVHTRQGRTLVSDPVLQQLLGITAQTPRWRASKELHSLIAEHPPWVLPRGELSVVTTNPTAQVQAYVEEPEILSADGYWLLGPEGITKLSAYQAFLLTKSGIRIEQKAPDIIAGFRQVDFALHLPTQPLSFLDPAGQTICVDEAGHLSKTQDLVDPQTPALPGVAGTVDYPQSPLRGIKKLLAVREDPKESTISLSGAPATDYHGLGVAVAVDTGTAVHIIDEVGTRHELSTDPFSFTLFGLNKAHSMPWQMLSLLPAGSPLTVERALEPVG